ncbi:alpha/beta hydrolase [Marinobacter sp. ATCH36]|uniref:alpha/beta fold hydrolase n=1 Tax=Marinobacter sp. ATCH36 TaxID=2945106 RepID=UPI0020226102|nr:alpha/beta hydrolase [Marinobacter sp. ATCH36]MCL7943405.1 alpha/beta hydrolase [Marinobacter sp. ATCH36]
MNDSQTRHLQLSDGRTLSYSDTGDGVNGTWVHCHGIPGSRYELAHLAEDLSARGVRIIIPDRPGYGDSTPHPHYSFEQHSADLRQLADHLGLQRFSVSGFSGGGVFAMATAHDLGERIKQLTIAATPAVPLMDNPFAYASELTANAWQAALEDTDKLARELQVLTESAEVLSDALISSAGQLDREHLSSEQLRRAFHKSTETALQQGPTGSAKALARDSRLIAQRWPFRPENLKVPVRVIHGQSDELVHKEHQSVLSAYLPIAKRLLFDGEGHYSVIRFIWK